MRRYRNGRVVDEEGICKHEGVPASDLNHGVSWSSSETFIESRRLYELIHHTGRMRKKATDPMMFGRHYHTATLEPKKWADIVVMPKMPKNTIEGKAAWEAFDTGRRIIEAPTKTKGIAWKELAAENPDALVVTPAACEQAQVWLEILNSIDNMADTIDEEDHARAEAIRDAVHEHKFARTLLEKTEFFEKEIAFDHRTGLRVFQHPDAMYRGTVWDLKGTRFFPEPQQWTREIRKGGYHRQAGTYSIDGHREVYGCSADRFFHVCVRTIAPHVVSVLELSPEFIAAGAADFHHHLGALARCVGSGDWRDSYEKGSHVLELPPGFDSYDIAYEVQEEAS